MLRQWGSTLERACESIIADVHAGKLLDDTMERHFDYIRHLMGRREIIVNEIMKYSRHKGPGTPGYIDLGGKAGNARCGGATSSDPASGATFPSRGRQGETSERKEAGGDVAE